MRGLGRPGAGEPRRRRGAVDPAPRRGQHDRRGRGPVRRRRPRRRPGRRREPCRRPTRLPPSTRWLPAGGPWSTSPSATIPIDEYVMAAHRGPPDPRLGPGRRHRPGPRPWTRRWSRPSPRWFAEREDALPAGRCHRAASATAAATPRPRRCSRPSAATPSLVTHRVPVDVRTRDHEVRPCPRPPSRASRPWTVHRRCRSSVLAAARAAAASGVQKPIQYVGGELNSDAEGLGRRRGPLGADVPRRLRGRAAQPGRPDPLRGAQRAGLDPGRAHLRRLAGPGGR